MKKQVVVKFNIGVNVFGGVEASIQKFMNKNNCHVVSMAPITSKQGMTDNIIVVFEYNM